jgi:hypothetical protein
LAQFARFGALLFSFGLCHRPSRLRETSCNSSL